MALVSRARDGLSLVSFGRAWPGMVLGTKGIVPAFF